MTTVQALNDLGTKIMLISNEDVSKIAIEIENHIGYLIERHPDVNPDIVRLKFINSLISVFVSHQKVILDSLTKEVFNKKP